MYEKIIVDADLCIKLGQSGKYHFLYDILPLVANEIYMHRHAYGEVMSPESAVEQLNKLIDDKKVIVVSESSLNRKDRVVYDAAFRNLSAVMIDPRKPNKNKGEVSSLAYAKATGIPIFATDESHLQAIIDSQLNTGINDITCCRIVNIVEKIRDGEIQLPRKTAKALWRIAGNSNELFDKEIWPIT